MQEFCHSNNTHIDALKNKSKELVSQMRQIYAPFIEIMDNYLKTFTETLKQKKHKKNDA